MKDYKRLDEKIWDFMKREWSSGDEDDPGEYEIAEANGVDVESDITFKDLMLELLKGKKFYEVIYGLDSEPSELIIEELNSILDDDEYVFDRFRNEDAKNSKGFSNWYNSLTDEEKLKIELGD